MCTKISTKKILRPEDFLPLVAKQGQTLAVQGQTNKYLEGHGNAHLITCSFHTYIYLYIYKNVCFIFPLFREVIFFSSSPGSQNMKSIRSHFLVGENIVVSSFSLPFPPLPQWRGIRCLFTGAHCALS